MRPARKGPENPRPASAPQRRPSGFNEAGPQGAAKPETLPGHFAVVDALQ